MQIEIIDSPDEVPGCPFAADGEAIWPADGDAILYIAIRAWLGSEMHAHALRLDHQSNPDHYNFTEE